MLSNKVIVVLDRATEMPVLVTKISVADTEKYPILRNAGFFGRDYILFAPLEGSFLGRSEYDPFEWQDRTNTLAHYFLQKNWDKVTDIVDITQLELKDI